ncbi:T9SS type A sorting domain-containing protein [Maribacter sp. CXY002]|uniref:T9SS type A sorting domain-containing protein n=1 Tax=Maribacter luteocoastalis TaxID=3407671 RepID=UPI003B681F59
MRTILLVFLLVPLGLCSQALLRQTLSVGGTSGMVTSGQGNYFLQESIGQLSVINTFTVENKSLRQGFLQQLRLGVLGSNPNILEMVVYPNPFVNGVVVNLENTEADVIGMFLYDITGRLILNDVYDNNTQLAIPLENLSKGAYFIRLQVGEQENIKQVIKQ